MSSTTKTQSLWETTSRLLATLVNEGLVEISFTPANSDSGFKFKIEARDAYATTEYNTLQFILVGVHEGICDDEEPTEPLLPLSPADLRPPIIVEPRGSDESNQFMDFDPGALFEMLSPWLGFSSESKVQILEELRSSAEFQQTWLQQSSHKPELSLDSASADWEMAIIRGHPTHPMHRTLLAQVPLEPIALGDLADVQQPNIVFVSIPRHQVTTVGSFEELLDPLLREQEVDISVVPRGRIVLPCLQRQLPSIRQRLGSAVSLLSSKSLRGRAQSSLRTISLPSSSAFCYDLKLALACNVTSALRTITPWTALIGPEVTGILRNALPPDMWVCSEVAAATGSQKDFDVAKHCSVLIRENLEGKARAIGERLIVSAALAERGVGDEACHAERIFELYTSDQKEAWFRHYTFKLLSCTLPPIYRSGVSLEGHAQNILARFHITSKTLIGFAYRDFGGLKLHTPTLLQEGYEVKSSPLGSLILTDNVHELWENSHHTIFQSHINQLVQALHLQQARAWAIVRQELVRVLDPENNNKAKPFYDYLTQDMVPYKCFLRMKAQGLYRDYIHHDVQNVILR